jgi:hypothetical protein
MSVVNALYSLDVEVAREVVQFCFGGPTFRTCSRKLTLFNLHRK